MQSLSSKTNKLVLIGVGQVAMQVATLASTYSLIGTTRDQSKIALLKKLNIAPFFIAESFTDSDQNKLDNLLDNANILVSFPPDGHSDKLFSSLCSRSNKIIYISSTSVYGSYHGTVDETTPVDNLNERAQLRLEAEQYWLQQKAIVLRAPGLYGPDSGLHLRLKNNSYRLPPKNDNYISRIHLQDLARIILTAFAKPLPASSIYLVGDIQPATQLEVITWLCQQMNLPLPQLAQPDQVPVSLTASRRVEAKKILDQLQIKLEFPTYKEGYLNCLQESEIINAADRV